MSEEEAIKMLKEYSATNPFQKNMFYVHNLHEAIQCLLDLYNKEKEKNKKLNKYIEDRSKIGKDIQTYINKDYVNQEYINKDKIRDKIKELKQQIIENKYVECKEENEDMIELLQELLEE